MLLKEKNN